jgi:predicted phosphodiesterase
VGVTRLGVISDVHGNLVALQSVVAVLREQGVDEWLSLGDLVGFGPFPNECVELVAELGARGVAGNHDLVAIGELPGASSSERAQRSHAWTRQLLSDDTVRYLRALPRRLDVAQVTATHGSLDDPEEYVRTPAAAARQLEQLATERPSARLLLVGNTHRQFCYLETAGVTKPLPRHLLPVDERVLANPGSVGQSRQWEWPPRARAMVLDLDRAEMQFLDVRYDVRRARDDLRRHGLPYDALHATPPLGPSLRRAAKRILG